MDTSEVYIKMCEKAEEIQSLRHNCFYSGDYVSDGTGVTFHPDLISVVASNKTLVWLPRQDQLQEIVGGRVYKEATQLIHWAYSWNDTIYQQFQFQSMEQFWLVFVMKEKYNKVWDGEQWTT